MKYNKSFPRKTFAYPHYRGMQNPSTINLAKVLIENNTNLEFFRDKIYFLRTVAWQAKANASTLVEKE